jgi:hypothetical protein
MTTLPSPKQVQDWIKSTVQSATNLAEQQRQVLEQHFNRFMQTLPPWLRDAIIQAAKHAEKLIEYLQKAFKAWNSLPGAVRDTLLSVTPVVGDGLDLVEQAWSLARGKGVANSMRSSALIW